MKNPLNVNGKIIDAAGITAVKPIDDFRLATIDTTRPFTAEIRVAGNGGAFVENASVEDVVTGLKQHGEELVMLKSGEAIRAEWITSIKPFSTRTAAQNRFRSVVQFRQPETGLTAQEWFIAPVEDIPGGDAPRLNELAKPKAPKEPIKKAAPAGKLDTLVAK
jgi:hypothetical protein